ncbi:MAG: hypothetical protein KatS3mg039_0461 [Candidatus Kapaibacterium sp.]|nr:MAG: hypothetical protein KatS3mg039_0461 [Candidatus Kapabacteria bacterium]
MRISIRTAAFSLLLSLMLWVFVTLQAEYEVTAPISLDLQLPADRSLRSPLPAELYVKLRGSGWNLLNVLYLDRSTRIVVDLPRDQRHGTLSQAELRAGFRSPVPLRLVSIEPSAMDYELDIVAQKKVRVQPQVELGAADGYVLTRSLVIVPDSVVIVGSQTVVDTIQRWRTASVRRTDLRKSIVELVPMERSPIVRVLPEKVLIKGVVQPLAEVTYYDVPVRIEAQLPPDAEILPPMVTVIIRAGLEDIEQTLDSRTLPVTVRIGQQQVSSDAELIEPSIVAPSWVHSVAWQPRFLVYRQVKGALAGSAISKDASP